MKLHLTERYYKASKVGREPIKFHVRQLKGVGTDVYGTIWLDPVLKDTRNSDLRKALMQHELDEIKAWGEGQKATHTQAKGHEPTLARNLGGVSGFWREIKRRQMQTGGSLRFPTWKAAHDFAKQKRKEGYEVEGCGGKSTSKSQQYIVNFKKASGDTPQESVKLHAYVSETPNHIVARMKAKHQKPMRSTVAISEAAKSALDKAGISGVKVRVGKIPTGGKHMDAATRVTEISGTPKPDLLIIHPMHQYTSNHALNMKIQHEVGHIREILRRSKPVRIGVGYADRGKTRMSRKHHRGWKRIKL